MRISGWPKPLRFRSTLACSMACSRTASLYFRDLAYAATALSEMMRVEADRRDIDLQWFEVVGGEYRDPGRSLGSRAY
jgi:hypothetical protein